MFFKSSITEDEGTIVFVQIKHLDLQFSHMFLEQTIKKSLLSICSSHDTTTYNYKQLQKYPFIACLKSGCENRSGSRIGSQELYLTAESVPHIFFRTAVD